MPSYVTKEITAVSRNNARGAAAERPATAPTIGAMPAKNSSRLNHGIITRSSSRHEPISIESWWNARWWPSVWLRYSVLGQSGRCMSRR